MAALVIITPSQKSGPTTAVLGSIKICRFNQAHDKGWSNAAHSQTVHIADARRPKLTVDTVAHGKSMYLGKVEAAGAASRLRVIIRGRA